MNRRSFLQESVVFILLTKAPASAIAAALNENQQKSSAVNHSIDFHIKDQLPKKRDFDKFYNEDIVLDKQYMPVLESALTRLERVQKIVGYANFSILDLDEAVKIGKSYSEAGSFSAQELDFFEKIFFFDASRYGFMGKKPISEISSTIDRKKVKKIPYTGNFLYLGKPVQTYERVKKILGNDLILTSGVRGVIKQFLLFLNKTKSCNGNLSMASRSLAPPGYSFHGIGDFDVGKKGYGIHNFTKEFTKTSVFHRLSELGFIKLRYEQNNSLGVRFEPWHIEVV